MRTTRSLALAAAGVLATAGLAACADGRQRRPAGAGGPIAVTATDTACEVGTTDAGRRHRHLHGHQHGQQGHRVLRVRRRATGSWARSRTSRPGLSRELHVELPAGTYQTACKPGMSRRRASAARSRSPASAHAADRRRRARRGRPTNYQRYVQEPDRRAAGQDRRSSSTAVKAGDVAKAKALYPVARTYWERIEPVAESFGDLDPKIDGREDDHRGGHGVHRLPPDREGPLGQPATSARTARSPTSCWPTSRRSWPRPTPRSSPRCSWPTAPRSCSTRSPPARSPARRTATRTPTCGTSRPTSRAPRPPSRRCARRCEERDAALVDAARHRVRRRRGGARQAPRRRRLEAAHRADQGRAQGARPTRSTRWPSRSARSPRPSRSDRRAQRDVDVDERRAGVTRRRAHRAWPAPGWPGSPAWRPARRRCSTAPRRRRPRRPTDPAGGGAVPRRAPGRHRHPGPGPAALRRLRRDHQGPGRAGRAAAGVDGRRGPDDRRAGRRARSARSAACRRPRRTTPARRSACRRRGSR